MNKASNIIPVLFKFLVGFGLIWIIYQHIQDQLTVETLSVFIDTFSTSRSSWLIPVLVLMPVNWGIESKKWQLANRFLEKIPLRVSWKSILAGISFGMLTPARIGEIGGRLVYLQRENRTKAIGSWMICGFTQLLATLFFGSIGILVVIQKRVHILDSIPQNLIIAISILCVLVFWFSKDLVRWLSTVSWLQKISPWVTIQEQLLATPRSILNKVLSLAFMRYTVYVFQYFCLAKWFGVELVGWLPFACIASIFFVRIALPLPPVLGLLASGELAIMIWGIFDVTEIIAVSMTFILWIINLALPAIIGLFIIWKEDLKTLYLQPRRAHIS